jgi:hypothetical protein
VKRFAELGDAVVAATQDYVAAVQSSAFPAAEHSFSGAAPRPKPVTEDTGTRKVAEGGPAAYGPAADEPS